MSVDDMLDGLSGRPPPVRPDLRWLAAAAIVGGSAAFAAGFLVVDRVLRRLLGL